MRVGLVGCGLIGQRRAKILASRPEGQALIVAADTTPGRADAVAELTGFDVTDNWRDIVARKDLDAVIVSTSHQWLAPVTIAALQAGKHVLC